MTADIVNLRRARKARARLDKQQQGAENRVRFGRTKEERRADEAKALRDARTHAGNERQRGAATSGAGADAPRGRPADTDTPSSD